MQRKIELHALPKFLNILLGGVLSLTLLGFCWRLLIFHGDDRQVHEIQSGKPPSLDYLITLRQAPNLPQGESLQIKLSEVEKPFECEHMFLHVVSSPEYEDQFAVWVRRQLEWLSLSPGDCYMSISPLGQLPFYHHITSINAYVIYKNIQLATYRSRYDVLAALIGASQAGFLTRPRNADNVPADDRVTPSQLSVPWIMFTDVDVIPLNKNKTIAALLDRIEAGLKLHQTTETRICQTDDYFRCRNLSVRVAEETESIDSLAFVIANDNFCQDDWMLNAGVTLTKPSRVAGFIHQSVLRLFNDTSPVHHFDDSDQARIGLVLREVFDFVPDFMRSLCAPIVEHVWVNSSAGDEILFLLKLNMETALNHPLLGPLAVAWFPDARLWPGEPDSVAIVNSRWMNAPACQANAGFGEARHKHLFLNCGDMLAHFNGCAKGEYKEEYFRALVTRTKMCEDQLPFVTNDNGTAPFDLEAWLNEAEPSSTTKRYAEPRQRLQYGN